MVSINYDRLIMEDGEAFMLFNSYLFILIFLPLTWCIYFGLNKLKKYRSAQGELILASLIFYGSYNWKYLFIMVASILVNYTISRLGGVCTKANY